MKYKKGEVKGMLRKTNEKLIIKNTKGITLIALVITIIVILILARSKYKHAIWR